MKFEATIKLFSELRKSEIKRSSDFVMYNDYSIDENDKYFKHLNDNLDSFYAEFQTNYFETSRELIEFLQDDINKIRGEIEKLGHPHFLFNVISEERLVNLGLVDYYDADHDFDKDEISGLSPEQVEIHGKIRKMVLYQIKIISILEKFLDDKIRFQEDLRARKMKDEKITNTKIKLKLSKTEIALLFLILNSNGIIQFNTNQELVTYVESNFMYYNPIQKTYEDISKLDSEISKIKGNLYKKPSTLKQNLLKKLENPGLQLNDGELV